MKICHKYLFVFFFSVGLLSYANDGFRFIDKHKKKESVRIKVISNLVVLPIQVNGVVLNFILDSGVSKPILFYLGDSDSLDINDTETILINGLGSSEPVEAIRSRNNQMRIGGMINPSQELFAVLNQDINFSPTMGMPIHGIIGYDLLKDFVVEINYTSKRLTFYSPSTYSYKDCRRCEDFPIELSRKKPYLNTEVSILGEAPKQVKLLVDSGASDALWLFHDREAGIAPPKQKFRDFLGKGLGGSVFGDRSVVKTFSIGDFQLESVKAAFPDSSAVALAKNIKDRRGSLGGEILKRFHVVLDYPNSRIRLKKNTHYKKPFHYNMSGIELQHNGMQMVTERTNSSRIVPSTIESNDGSIEIRLYDVYNYMLKPAFEIADLRPGSPAEEAGLRKGDILVSVNSKLVYRYKLQEVIAMLSEKEHKKIRLCVQRNGIELVFDFKLKDPLRQ